MINARYFVDPKDHMPVPTLTFHNYAYGWGYWKHWYVMDNDSLANINLLLESVPSGSLILFDDRFCNEKQYAILTRYDYNSYVAYFQLLNDQLQLINATASLKWDSEDNAWCMSIQSACLYLRSNSNYPDDELKLTSCIIHDGVLGEYYLPGK